MDLEEGARDLERKDTEEEEEEGVNDGVTFEGEENSIVLVLRGDAPRDDKEDDLSR